MADNIERREVEINVNTNAEQASRSINTLNDSLETTQTRQTAVTNETQRLNTAQQNSRKSTKELAGSFVELDNPISNAISGFKDLIKSMWTLVANPIGAVLTAIVVVVGTLGKAFLSTEEGSNKLNKGIAIVSGAFSGLMKILEPVAAFIVDGIVKGFEMAGEALLFTANLFQSGLRALGFDTAADGLNNLTKSIQGNIKASKQLADAEAELQKQQRLSTKIQLDYQKQAEKLRQQRDDETKSVKERIAINDQLGKVLQKQLNEELKIANQALKLADMRIKLEGKSTANLDARAEALTNIADIQERISGQESEQLANLNSLRREQEAIDKERRAERERIAKEQFDKEFAQAVEQAKIKREFEEQVREQNRITREEEIAEEEEALFREVQAIKKKADEEKAIELALQKQKEELQVQRISLAEKGVALIAQIFGKNKKILKATMIAESAISIGKTVASTLEANAKAVAATPLTAGQPFVALNTAQAVVGIASTIASTQKALQSLGGGSAPNVGNGALGASGGGASQPQVSFQASSENQIATATANNINQQPPIQAFVVESEVTTAQSLANNRITANSLG
jgi:hypothetical protein